MLLFRMTYFSLLRLIREPIGQLLLLVLPLIIISVIGTVITGPIEGMDGVPSIDWMTTITIFTVQFFGGTYLMSLLNDDLLQTRKWRTYSLPIHVAFYSSSLILACALFSTLQGFVMVLFTKWVFGVQWGSLGWVLLVLAVFSLFAQFIHLALVLSIKSFKLSERVSEIIGLGLLVLTGLMFPLPDHAFFNWMSSYGNPVMLGQRAVTGMLPEGDAARAGVSLALLAGITAFFMIISFILGRRRLG
ncbi:ABC transporter permease [Paenibacillus sp. FSL M8-0334]|uniref:ABC transporter n=1 Tax=Paenibacillus campinasensis TaxID=66347 RepID=A0ABW9T6K8_9BACL|nr:ABC transporter permease [Paenibacillus campinasensis]MUG66801.1 ABC transporter [Paenibacillus campinasensis]